MASLLPPSPSVSPGPNPNGSASKNSRASIGPSVRSTVGLQPLASPRPGGVPGSTRPTSELLGGGGMFQTPEAEALDQWFENLQNYEVTLEEMAAASLDVNFKEELSAIEQWFKVLSEAERTAALYSLLQHSTQVQIRFFITVLQQMARSDPMTALLSPAAGGSMQSQMEAKLANMGLKSPAFASSPTARNFSLGPPPRSSSGDNFLSPDAANVQSGDAASTLAQQRAKLKANNAAHRISAPALASGGADGRTTWGSGAPQLSQVAERPASPSQEAVANPVASNSTRPKSTDFAGVANSFRSPRTGNEVDVLSPIVGDSWASMVNTPLVPMFKTNDTRPLQNLDNATNKLSEWAAGNRVPLMDDPKKFRRQSKNNAVNANTNEAGNHAQPNGDDAQHNTSGQRPGGFRSNNHNGPQNGVNGHNGIGGQGGWNTLRSPVLTPGGMYNDDGGLSSGIGLGGFNMGSPGMGMPGAGVLGNMPMSPFNMNMNMLAAMGMTPEQMLAAQMAAAGQFSPAALSGGLSFGMALQQQQQHAANQRAAVARGARSPGGKSSASGRLEKKDEEEVDPKVLEDVPMWLRTLRLHKYTPNFEGMSWRDMVILDEAQLEAKGVGALGARRKMLKTFEVVRKKFGIEMPAGSNTTTTSA